jgi:hypothetical protein
MGGSVIPKIVTNGLVLYLDAANPKSFVSGSTVWNDLTTYITNGTITNGPTYNSSNGGSIVFDGSDDCILLNNLTAYSNTQPHTYCAWTYTTNFGVSYKWIINNGGSATGTSLITYNNNGYKVGFFYQGGVAFQSSTGTLTLNTWNFISAVYNGVNSVTFYINGAEAGTASVGAATWAASGNIPRIGTWYNGSYPFQGRLSNVQVYNRALSAQEVQQNYNAMKKRFGL